MQWVVMAEEHEFYIVSWKRILCSKNRWKGEIYKETHPPLVDTG